MAENTSTCLKTLGALAAVIGTSCPSTLKRDSGSVIEVAHSPASFSWKYWSLCCKTASERTIENAVIMFCLAETTCESIKNDTFEEVIFLSATVQELSGSESVLLLSFWPRETAPAGAQEQRMKR